MRSDHRAVEALQAVRGGIAAYHTMARTAADRIESYLAARDDHPTQERAARELGGFAADRIDAERFAALWSDRPVLEGLELALMQRAHDMLRELESLPEARFVVDVPTGGRLNGVLANTLAELGRPFGAMLVAELARSGRYDQDAHSSLLHGFPRHRWNRAEREAAPPVVITLDGADLWAGEIAQFLDGNQKIVLVVSAPAPPAALARLITPGTTVVQTTKLEVIGAALAAEGPVVAALMPQGAAEFVHRAQPGLPAHERLTVAVAAASPRRALQSWTVWQQEEELRHLQALAAAPAVPATATAPASGNGLAPAADPVDRLAGWLLSQADLTATH